MLSLSLHNGQDVLSTRGGVFSGCDGALFSFPSCDWIGFFSGSGFGAVLGSLAGDILGETVGVPFGEALETGAILGETCVGADIFREPGGVVRDSS